MNRAGPGKRVALDTRPCSQRQCLRGVVTADLVELALSAMLVLMGEGGEGGSLACGIMEWVLGRRFMMAWAGLRGGDSCLVLPWSLEASNQSTRMLGVSSCGHDSPIAKSGTTHGKLSIYNIIA
jgi:hypothetical protein